MSVALIICTAVTISYFSLVRDLLAVRVVVISFLLAVLSGLTARSLLRAIPPARRLTYRTTGGLFAACSLFMTARAVLVAYRPDMYDLFAPSLLQFLTFLLPLLLGIFWTFGFFILNSERLELDLLAQINERRSAEEALQKSEEEYRLLIETLAIPVLIEVSGRIVYANPAAVALIRASSADEVMDRRVVEFAPPELFDTIEERRRIMTREMHSLPPMEMNIRRLDGTSVAVASRSMPIVYRGKPAVLNALYEITQQKRSEIELQKAHKLLQLDGRNIQALQARLKEEAIRDSLTDLFNRRYVEETLARELPRAAREGYPVGAAMIDVVNLRALAEEHGPEVGDLILQAVGNFLLGTVRAEDIAGRYGSEKFILVLPRATPETMTARAAEWRRGVDALLIACGEGALRANILVGTAVYPNDAETGEALIRAADSALQAAREALHS